MKWVSLAHGLRFVRYFNACGAQPDGTIGEAHNPSHSADFAGAQPHTRDILRFLVRPRSNTGRNLYPDYIHVCDLAQAHILALDYLLNRR